jgi:hypothetical protein
MSGNVASALHLLGKDVRRAEPGSPGQGVPDSEVAKKARQQRRVIFTNNFDMVVAAIDEATRVIWFYDQRDNSPTRFNTARLFFLRWEKWENMLASAEADCLRVSMTRTAALTKDQARDQAAALDQRTKAKRKKFKAQAAQPKLFFPD